MKQELSPAIEDFISWRRSQDLAKNTLAVDRQVLKRFLAVTGNIWCHQLEDRHVDRHFEVAARTRQASSLKNDHTVLNAFFAWARHTRRIPVDSNPMFGRRHPRRTEKEKNRVPVRDFPRLLDAAEARCPRDRALMALLLYTLQRDGEVTGLRYRDLDLQDGWLTTRIPKSRLEDRMPVCEELDHEMREWLKHYQEVIGHKIQPHYFLVPARGVSPVFENNRIVRHHTVYKPETRIRSAGPIVQPILESIDFPVVDEKGKKCGEGAHTIRRSGARALFDQLVESGYDHSLRLVQSMLHHKSIQMTERYLGITADRRSRDEIIRHKRMYAASDENVVRLAR